MQNLPIQPPVVHITLSPTRKEVTLTPTACTTPEHSIPTYQCK